MFRTMASSHIFVFFRFAQLIVTWKFRTKEPFVISFFHNRELIKEATFVNHERKAEVNISHAMTMFSPRFSN